MKISLIDDGLDGLDLPSNNPQCSHEIGGKLQSNITNIVVNGVIEKALFDKQRAVLMKEFTFQQSTM